MKHVIAILGLLFLAFIWAIPAFMIYHGAKGEWGIAYIPIAALTAGYGYILLDWYIDK